MGALIYYFDRNYESPVWCMIPGESGDHYDQKTKYHTVITVQNHLGES